MFRSYLLGLHAEEVQHDQQYPAEGQWREEQLLMNGHPKSVVPAETRRDQDAQSVISALSCFRGMVLNIATARIKPPIYFIGRDNGNDDTSDASNDSNDESSGPNLPEPSIVSQDFSRHQKQPRCSSMAYIAPSECLSRQQQRKAVDFSFVRIREYDTILDTNPAVTKGPAIALGWNLLAEHVLLVNDHDKGHRRDGEALMLSTHTRQGILQKKGYSHRLTSTSRFGAFAMHKVNDDKPFRMFECKILSLLWNA